MKSARVRGRAPGWLRFALVCALLVVVPITAYLFVYQRQRVEQATIRNFRALDAAAERVVQVMARLEGVVEASSFGISPTLLDEVTERITGQRTGCVSDNGVGPRPWDGPVEPPKWSLLRQPTPAQRLEYRYWRAAETLVKHNERNGRATERLWNQLHCLIDTHREYSTPVETIRVEVEPFPRVPLRPPAPSHERCGNLSNARCRNLLREFLAAEECEEQSRAPRLATSSLGMAATIADCRPLGQRSRQLRTALKVFDGSEGVMKAIDLFGIRSTAQLGPLMQQATGYLSRFFDSHLIADGGGRILFEAEAPPRAGTEVDESRVATPAFSSHVDISELLRVDSSRSDGIRSRAGGDGEGVAATASPPYFRGRSFVELVGVRDIELRVFVHPFILDGIDVSGGPENTAGENRASANGAGRPTFYVVGIVDNSEFQSAAIRLRLSLVIYATLLLLVLLTMTPLLWYWTAGDRWMVGRLGLVGVCATPVVGVVLLVVLACAMVTNRIDGQILDRTMARVADRVIALFEQELREEIVDLQGRVPRLLAVADDQAGWRRPEGTMHIWQTMNVGRNELSQLERTFYCDDAARNLPFRPLLRDFNAMLMDEQGLQLVCLSSGALSRTPKLQLRFREYFQLPMEGALWRPATAAESQPVRCRVRDPQDEESRIPCLVDDLPEPSKRPVTLAHPANPSAGMAEVPYFLERIDSVTRADVQTVLAVNTGRPGKSVAAAGIRLNSLDRAVPPEHIDFAVVDRETGRTLFHSDDGLAMATNFVEDVGGAPALWSLLQADAPYTIDLVYAGIPIRAHVRPLREGMPWTLIVYRGHELEDRLTAVTTALAIFFTLLWLIVIAALAVLVPLVIHWCGPGMPEGVASSLGRVMGMSSRFRWMAGASLAPALALLLFSPWLTWAPWPAANPWLPWNPWNPDSVWNPWRAFPFFAAYAVIAAAAYVVYSVLGVGEPTGGNRYGAGTLRRVLVLTAVIVCLAVVPTGLWFGHHRAALGVGVNHYLVDRTLDSVAREREDYRLAKLREFGAGEAPNGHRTLHRVHEEPATDESWITAALRPLVGFSQLSNELMIYRALPPVTAAYDVASLHGAFSRTFGYEVRWPFPEHRLGPLSVLSALWMLLIGIPVGGVAYFICAICTVVRSRGGAVVELPDARAVLTGLNKGGPTPGKPPRAIVIHRSIRDRERRVKQLRQGSTFVLRTHKVSKALHGCRVSVSWTPAGVTNRPSLYLFEDLEEVLEDSAEGRARLDELEHRARNGDPILMFSRVVPDYRYSDRFGLTDRWFHNRHGDGDGRRSRWSTLACTFRSVLLRDYERVENLFDEQLERTNPRTNPPAEYGPAARNVRKTMREEAVANPELLCAAVSVTADAVADLQTETMHPEDACTLAVTRFRKHAASYFNELWQLSTHDERLQLYALARGGVVNTRRTATLSSLVNRGIVEVHDATGVVRLRSRAFGEFIAQEIDHGELDAWRKEGGGGGWRLIWPPLAIGAVLGLAFLAMANPEMRTTLLTALLGLVPAALPFFRGGQSSASTGTTIT